MTWTENYPVGCDIEVNVAPFVAAWRAARVVEIVGRNGLRVAVANGGLWHISDPTAVRHAEACR